MHAFAYHRAHPIAEFAITEHEVPAPSMQPGDLLVRIKAFSVNPVDYKIRQSRDGGEQPVILGWDAAGIVEAVGAGAQGFKVGDEVYYAGDLNRAGSYGELQAIDHRLVARKPSSLSFADAASLPLTALTAYEALFERGVEYTNASHVLIIGGAGGVGSMAIQLLKALTPATVIATATRPETIAWVKQLGADHVIGRDLKSEVAALGISTVDVVFSTTHSKNYLPIMPDLLRPFGHMMIIDDPEVLDIRPFKPKALSVHWEFMFSKSMFGYQPQTQGATLSKLAALVDAGTLRSTRTQTWKATAENIKRAHETLEAATAIGKIVLER